MADPAQLSHSSATPTRDRRSPPRPLPAWLWPVAFLVVAALVIAGLVLTAHLANRATRELARTPVEVLDRAAEIAGRFSQSQITESFMASLPVLSRESGGLLELASTRAIETFSRSDTRTVAWDLVSLGTTVTEIRVPVTYRYHLRLRDAWRIDVSNHVCVVHAPRIRPTQPPAIDTAGLEKRSERGWLRFNTEEQMAQLERSITPTLRLYAGDPQRLALVRDASRRTVAEFVRDWLARNDQWRPDRYHAIVVLFPDETQLASQALGLEPTLELR